MKSTVYRRGADGSMVGTPEDHRGDTGHKSAAPGRSRPPKAQRRQAEVQRQVRQRAEQWSGTPSARRLTRKMRWVQLALGAYVLSYVGIGVYTAKSVVAVPAAAAAPIADTAGTNWLLVGSDSRNGLSLKEQHQLHTGPDSGVQRSDVIILVHFDGYGAATLVSLPRDSYIEIPQHVSVDDGTTVPARKNKLNAAFAFGGAPLLTATVEHNTGLHIDHFMQIGFAGIRDVTDAVGGVRICAPATYDDKNSGLHITKGCHHVNGKTALAYVRMRYADPTGDIGRIQRQQQYLSALLHTVLRPATLANPVRMFTFAKAATSSVVLGKGDGPWETARLALAMRGLSSGKGKVATVPIANPDGTSAVGSVVLWDQAAAADFFAGLGAH